MSIHVSADLKRVKIGGNFKDIKIIADKKRDFGLSQRGTPFYIGPEVWLEQPQYLSVDIWALGCILYEMLTFFPPFSGNDFKEL